jgi:hypothetical protein
MREPESDLERIAAHVPAWLRPSDVENRLPVAIAVVIAIGCQLSIPGKYSLHPQYLIPSLEGALLIALSGLRIPRFTVSDAVQRSVGIALVAAITIDNALSAIALDRSILKGTGNSNNPTHLLTTGAAVYGTNVIAFGIWYWLLDRGGPLARAHAINHHPDFLFPQMTSPALAPPSWRPEFLDYLYISLTNVVAFSPTDTMPLSRWAKTLMAVQSLVALSTIGLVLARAVNILKS